MSVLATVVLLQAGASIALAPASGESGDPFAVQGSGFNAGDRVRVLWDGTNLGGNTRVETDGTFRYSATVPAGSSPGSHTVEAKVGKDSVTATFNVMAPVTTTTTTTSPPTTTTATTASAPTTTAARSITTATTTNASSTTSTTIVTFATSGDPAGVDTSPTTLTTPTSSPPEEGRSLGGVMLALTGIALIGGTGGFFLWAKRRSAATGEQPPTAVAVGDPPVGERGAAQVELTQAGWHRHRMGLGIGASLQGMTSLKNGFLALGGSPDSDGVMRGTVWGSVEGVRWSLVSQLDPGMATLAIPWRADLLVLGLTETSRGQTASTWSSVNGEQWQRLTDPDSTRLSGVIFDGVAVTDEFLVAYGRGPMGSAAWISPDGSFWEQSSLRGAIDLVVPIPSGVFAFGRDPVERRPILATSIDGRSWQRLSQDNLFVFEGAAVTTVIEYQGGLVAAGSDKMKGAAGIWVSDDEVHWHRVPLATDPGTSIQHLARVGDLLVAVGADLGTKRSRQVGTMAVWESPDGVSWSRVEAPEIFSASTVTAVGVSRDLLVVGGALRPGIDSPWSEVTPATWVYERGSSRWDEGDVATSTIVVDVPQLVRS